MPLRVEIYDPLGNLVGFSLPIPGPAIATAVPLGVGTYPVKAINLVEREVTYDNYRLIQEAWPLLPPPPLP